MRRTYTKPEIRCYGTVEHITGTFNTGSDFGDEAGKKFAFSYDWHGTLGGMPLPNKVQFDRFSA